MALSHGQDFWTGDCYFLWTGLYNFVAGTHLLCITRVLSLIYPVQTSFVYFPKTTCPRGSVTEKVWMRVRGTILVHACCAWRIETTLCSAFLANGPMLPLKRQFSFEHWSFSSSELSQSITCQCFSESCRHFDRLYGRVKGQQGDDRSPAPA